jgi:LTXXQ motif family protein
MDKANSMKTRWIALMISGLALTTPAVTPAAYSEANSLTQLFPALVGIQLMPAQQTQLMQLSQQTLPQIQQLLSAEQLSQFNTALKQGQTVRLALTSLDLSIPQQFKLRNVMQSVRSQLTHILTPEQQEQLMQNARSLQQSR